jgi:hypothetical protein
MISWRFGDELQIESKGTLLENSSFSRGTLNFFYWMRPSYISESNLLYSELTDLSVNHLNTKTPSENFQPDVRALWSRQLTKI